MDFPILHDPGSIEMLLRTVAKTDPPKVVDHDYLVSLGFKREVDEGLLKLLKFLGFIDEQGRPTVLWVNYTESPGDAQVLGESIKESYQSLFKKYPGAAELDGSLLMEFFKNSVGTSDPDAAYMVLTFKVLCDLAESGFSESLWETAEEEPEVSKKKASTPVKGKTEPTGSRKTPLERDTIPPIRISINIDLDESSDPELRELAMRLLKKQLEL